MNLPEGQILQHGKYKLTHAIGQGGFGITYKGVWNTEVKGPLGTVKTEVPVCVKEFFFKDYCYREADSLAVKVHSETGKTLFNKFKEKLIKEAKILSEVHHHYIVNVLEVFEENNTAYITMEYIAGSSLKSILERDGVLPEALMLTYVRQIGEALQFVHDKNILHLDIKPSNILIDKEGNARLIDFGVSKRYDLDQEETSTTMLTLSKGFASIEQYDNEGTQIFSPHPDIYSLGATMYYLLTGKIPTESILRATRPLKNPSEINPAITRQTEAVILKAMQIIPADRFDSISKMMEALDFSQIKENEKLVPSEHKEIQEEENETTVLYTDHTETEEADDEETVVNIPEDQTVLRDQKFPIEKKIKKKKKYSLGISIFVIIGSAIGALFYSNKPSKTVVEDEIQPTLVESEPKPIKKDFSAKAEEKVTPVAVPVKSQPEKAEEKVKVDKKRPKKEETKQPEKKVEKVGLIEEKVQVAQPTEAEVNKKYHSLIASAKEKMAGSDFTGAKMDLSEAKNTKLTEEVVRLIIDCDAKAEQKKISDKIAQYEKKMSFGKYTIVRKRSNNRYGAIDSKGEERIPCHYLSVGIAEKGRAFEREDNLFDIYNSEGSLISQGATYY